jgi:iron complex transport system substrate-binding protein
MVVISCVFLSGCLAPGSSPGGVSGQETITPGVSSPEITVPPTPGPDFRLITDMTGREVIVPKNISRAGLLSGPIAQLPYIIGVSDRVVATTENLKRSPLLQQMDPRIATLPSSRIASMINIEEISRARPEIFICTELDGEVISRQLSVPVVYVTSTEGGGFNDTREQVRFFGRLFSREDRAESYCRFLDSGLQMVNNRTGAIPADQRKRVFFGFGTSHLSTFPGQNFMTERAGSAGCVNVAAGNNETGVNTGKIVPPQAEISLEQVIAWDPDIIVIDTGNVSEILQDPHWQTIKAVRTGNVFVEPEGIFKWSRPNPESAAMYSVWLAKTAYPERCTDVNLEDTIRAFYKEFFDYDLSSGQLTGILHSRINGSVTSSP